MSTKRQLILGHVKTILDAVSAVQGSEINRFTPPDLEKISLPYCFIYSDREEKITGGDLRGSIGSETWEWKIVIEVWSNEDVDQEELLGQIHSAMFADYTLGGHAEYSYRIGVEFLVVDINRNLKAMLIDYTVVYRHLKGNMSN